MDLIKMVLRHVLTGADNQTYHMGKFSWVVSTMTVIGVILHRAWTGLEVDLMAAAGALVAIATGHSATIYGMKSTEPPHDVVKPEEAPK